MYTIYYTCINVARGAHYLPHRGDNRTRRRQTSPHLARPAKFNVEYHELARGDTSFSQKMAAMQQDNILCDSRSNGSQWQCRK